MVERILFDELNRQMVFSANSQIHNAVLVHPPSLYSSLLLLFFSFFLFFFVGCKFRNINKIQEKAKNHHREDITENLLAVNKWAPMSLPSVDVVNMSINFGWLRTPAVYLFYFFCLRLIFGNCQDQRLANWQHTQSRKIAKTKKQSAFGGKAKFLTLIWYFSYYYRFFFFFLSLPFFCVCSSVALTLKVYSPRSWLVTTPFGVCCDLLTSTVAVSCHDLDIWHWNDTIW